MAGIPVVGARIGGIADLVDDGRTRTALRSHVAGRAGGGAAALIENPDRWNAWPSSRATRPRVKSIAEDAREWEADVCRRAPAPRAPPDTRRERAARCRSCCRRATARPRSRALLDAIARQRVDFPFEIVAVDSASTDGTADLLRGRVDRLIGIRCRRLRSRSDPQPRHRAGARRAGRPAGAGCGAGVGLLAGRADGAAPRGRPNRRHVRAAAAPARRQPRHAPLPRALSASSDAARTIAVADARRARGARSDGAARALHVRQRLLVHQAIGLAPASVPADADRRGHRVGEGGAAGGLSARVRPGGGGHPFARSVGALRVRPDVRAAPPACTNCSGCARFRRFRFWRARSLRRWWCICGARRRRPGLDGSGRAIALAFAWPLGQYLGALSAVRGWKPLSRSRMV